ncbi:MAG: NADH-quinone oxidoreductase subunit NuoE [bacterium]|nr:MAG: NADH-quinone oxidoreductase subunit NuoE [bacterium]
MMKSTEVFSAKEFSDMENIRARYQEPASAILPLLHYVQGAQGHLSEQALTFVAEFIGVPHVRTFEVATYYTMLFTEPVGRHLVQVCRNLSCHVNGAEEVLQGLKRELGIDVGATTPDRVFTLVEVECIGACDHAPAMMIDGDLHRSVTVDSVSRILNSYREKP